MKCSWFLVLCSWLLTPVLLVDEGTKRKKWQPRMHANGREWEAGRSWLLTPVLLVDEGTKRKKWQPRMAANGREWEGSWFLVLGWLAFGL
jgi:hypothetical protein